MLKLNNLTCPQSGHITATKGINENGPPITSESGVLLLDTS